LAPEENQLWLTLSNSSFRKKTNPTKQKVVKDMGCIQPMTRVQQVQQIFFVGP
jgi:hypothetical protein